MENNHNNKNMSKDIVRNKSENFKEFLESKAKDFFLRKLKVGENKLYNSEITSYNKFIVHKNKFQSLTNKLKNLKEENREVHSIKSECTKAGTKIARKEVFFN